MLQTSSVAHLDFDRDSESFKALAIAEIQFQLMGKDAVFFELLAIGQLVMNSPDVITLKSHLRSLMSNK